MSDKIRKSFRYASPIDCLIDTEIREYDISKANISVLAEKGYIGPDIHQALLVANKIDREIYIGKLIGNNPKASAALSEGIIEAKLKFFDANGIIDNEVLEIDNDAVYIIGSRPIVVQQVSPLVYFRLAERYTSFYSVKKIRYYYYSSRFDNSEKLTPKGLGEVAIGLHKNFMLDFLSELFYTNQYEGLDAGLRLLASFYQTYCSRTLPIEYYRNLNPQSMYTFIGFDQYATFYTSIYQDPRFKHLIDISYNERLLREFNQVLSYKYFRKE